MAVVRYDGIAPTAGASVTVYAAGTQDLVDLFADALGTPLGNPLTADALTGVYSFWTELAALNIVIGSNAAPADRVSSLLAVIVNGASPNRTVSLVIDDNGITIVLAQVTY